MTTGWLDDMTPPFDDGSPEDEMRARHWTYFSDRVEPVIYRAVNLSFPVGSPVDGRVREFVLQRVRLRNRFRPSEPLYFISEDMGWARDSHAISVLAAGLELMQFSRLIADDVIDRHTHRWGQTTLWAMEGMTGERSHHMAQVAHLTSGMLGKMALMCFEKAEQLAMDEGLLRTRHPGWAQIGLEVGHDMWACMLGELNASHGPNDFEGYKQIAAKKHCNGAFTARLVSAVLEEGERWAALNRALRATDLAASIANDFSEVNGQRGFGAPRSPAGEPRGELTEIQLGRPNVFTTFHGEDGFAAWWRVKREPVAQLQDLAALSQEELEDRLQMSGCLLFAKNLHTDCKADADAAIATAGMPTTAKWVNRSAQIHGRPKDGVTEPMLS